ncbi:MAG TPA: hypothetical protein DHW29_06210 [Acinetobacter ursingii]|uniref:Uncharacterized protein n=1 Tax=Acinetobacter ursingii TaxID=108980 RepID=A0A3D2SNW2_9GAMM|nr:hypothetical protein [Acinetobacter ursingii]
MKVFPIVKKNEFKQTIAILDTFELRDLIAEAIAEKLGIDLKDEKNTFYYTNVEKFKHLIAGEYKVCSVAVHFIEKV